MASQLLFDLDDFDVTRDVVTREQIEAVNPHRGHMMLLDGIIAKQNPGEKLWAIGYKDIRDDEFWVAGHIPGRPIFPGVLMIEAAAQLASYLFLDEAKDTEFMGFIGCDNVKFRGQVVPGDRLHILGVELKRNSRRIICQLQGVVDGSLVFEAKITGMPI